MDGDAQTAWQGIPGAGGWSLALVYDPPIALNGVTLDWAPDSPTNVQYLYSLDAKKWSDLTLPLTNGPVELNYLWLIFPDTGKGTPALREVRIE